MAEAGEAVQEQKQDTIDTSAPSRHRIVEPMIVIGRCEDGRVRPAFPSGMITAAAVVLLEQIRLEMVAGFNFDREPQRIVGAGFAPGEELRARGGH